MKKKALVTAISGIFLLAVCLVLWLWIFEWPNTSFQRNQQKIAIIPNGLNVVQIADTLKKQGILKHAQTFRLAAILTGKADRLKAGRYLFRGNMTNRQMIHTLYAGKSTLLKITIPEGLTAAKIAGFLARKLDLDSTKLAGLIADSEFARKLGVPASSLEGFLFPNTYFFDWGITEEEVLAILVKHFFAAVGDSLLAEINSSQFSILEVVTLASLIQGEAMLEEEMPLISAVYHNRLRRGMLLQADPTIQYIIPDGPRRLTKKDLAIDSPFNTYKYPGLPPGPVNNPGLAAIRAALRPANVPYLYFVARGDGGHTFSRTLQEHLAAKRKFDQIRREYYRKKQLEQERSR